MNYSESAVKFGWRNDDESLGELRAFRGTIEWWQGNFELSYRYAREALERLPEHETNWHHLALALSPYLVPFGFTWTTFLIMSLPLYSITLRRALRMRGAVRAAAIVGIAACWLAMQIVQVHDLWPLVARLVLGAQPDPRLEINLAGIEGNSHLFR